MLVVAIPLVLVVGGVILALGSLDLDPLNTTAPATTVPAGPTASSTLVETPPDPALLELSESTTTTTEPPRTTVAARTDPTELGAGVHAVGIEIAPGLYRVSISWARLDENMDVIDNDLTLSGVSLLPVFASDAYVELTGTAVPISLMPEIDPIASGLTQGTYLIGPDIEPGRYRITAEPGATAFAARLAPDLGVLEDRQDDSAVEMDITSTDFAFRYTGALERVE